MRVFKFLLAEPNKGWRFAYSLFFCSWSMMTITPLVLSITHTDGTRSDGQFYVLLFCWFIASCFVSATLNNVTRLADRVETLERELNSLRPAQSPGEGTAADFRGRAGTITA